MFSEAYNSSRRRVQAMGCVLAGGAALMWLYDEDAAVALAQRGAGPCSAGPPLDDAPLLQRESACGGLTAVHSRCSDEACSSGLAAAAATVDEAVNDACNDHAGEGVDARLDGADVEADPLGAAA